MHQLRGRPPLVVAAVAILTLAVAAALLALPREHAKATPPSGVTVELLARGTVAEAANVHVKGTKIRTRGPVDLAVVHLTFQPGGSTGWHTHPGPAMVAVKAGQVTITFKHCRTVTYTAGQAFVDTGTALHNARNTGSSTAETIATFVLPVGAPLLISQPAPKHCPV
jgi:quercetin dioxygenase-like cupin family protein